MHALWPKIQGARGFVKPPVSRNARSGGKKISQYWSFLLTLLINDTITSFIKTLTTGPKLG